MRCLVVHRMRMPTLRPWELFEPQNHTSTMYAASWIYSFVNIQVKKVNFGCRFFKKMALLACGWGLGRGLLSLAAAGFAYHLRRKVQYLEKCVQKLEDEKELKDVDAEARGFEMQKSEYVLKQFKNQQLESMDKERSRDEEGLEIRIQELEYDNKNLIELYNATSQGGDCMKKKLAVAEMQIREHAVVKEEMSKDLMQFESEKRKLSREVEGLKQLVRELEDNTTMLKALHNAASHGRACMEKKPLLAEKKIEDYAALNKEASENLKHLESEKQELQSSLNYSLEKVKKKQRVFEDYRTEADIFMDAALERVREKERECEDLALQSERHVQEKEELQREIERRYCNQEEATYAKSIALATAYRMEQSLPYIKWYNNPLYETKPARFTTAALSCLEEVTTGSEFIGKDRSSASPFIEWNDNPLYESQTARQATGHEENGANFVGRDP